MMTPEEIYKLAEEIEPKDKLLSVLIKTLAVMREANLEEEYVVHTQKFTGAVVSTIKYMEWLNGD